MIIVIADDITGAAEIAGIGLQYGLQVKLVMDYITQLSTGCDLLVCATNTRSLTEEEAIRQSHRLAGQLRASGCQQVFKKTDSALRGHLTAEIQPLLDLLHFKQALLIPQNPSKGRTIQNGIYYINDTPLHETFFKDDPEFPAQSSEVNHFLQGRPGFTIANATSVEQIKEYATSLPSDTLPAGGADFFSAYLEVQGYRLRATRYTFNGLMGGGVLVVCGSTVQHPLASFGYIQRYRVPIASMPLPVFMGDEAPYPWIERIKNLYIRKQSLIITIGHPPKTGKAFADRLKQILTRASAVLLSTRTPSYLIIEGGATAFSILQQLGYNEFTVKLEIAPGVIYLAPIRFAKFHIIIKPGSYSWGDTFK